MFGNEVTTHLVPFTVFQRILYQSGQASPIYMGSRHHLCGEPTHAHHLTSYNEPLRWLYSSHYMYSHASCLAFENLKEKMGVIIWMGAFKLCCSGDSVTIIEPVSKIPYRRVENALTNGFLGVSMIFGNAIVYCTCYGYAEEQNQLNSLYRYRHS